MDQVVTFCTVSLLMLLSKSQIVWWRSIHTEFEARILFFGGKCEHDYLLETCSVMGNGLSSFFDVGLFHKN